MAVLAKEVEPVVASDEDIGRRRHVEGVHEREMMQAKHRVATAEALAERLLETCGERSVPPEGGPWRDRPIFELQSRPRRHAQRAEPDSEQRGDEQEREHEI